MTRDEAFERGRQDAARERPPIWRSTRYGIVMNGGYESDEAMADAWPDENRRAYLDGYNT